MAYVLTQALIDAAHGAASYDENCAHVAGDLYTLANLRLGSELTPAQVGQIQRIRSLLPVSFRGTYVRDFESAWGAIYDAHVGDNASAATAQPAESESEQLFSEMQEAAESRKAGDLDAAEGVAFVTVHSVEEAIAVPEDEQPLISDEEAATLFNAADVSPVIYRGEYPWRVESVSSISEQWREKLGGFRYQARLNNGRVYGIKPIKEAGGNRVNLGDDFESAETRAKVGAVYLYQSPKRRAANHESAKIMDLIRKGRELLDAQPRDADGFRDMLELPEGVFQDGADFYQENACGNDAARIWSAPFPVKDFDMEAADVARACFKLASPKLFLKDAFKMTLDGMSEDHADAPEAEPFKPQGEIVGAAYTDVKGVRVSFRVMRSAGTYYLVKENGEAADEWIPWTDDWQAYLRGGGFTVEPLSKEEFDAMHDGQTLDAGDLVRGLSQTGLAVFTFDENDTEPQPANPQAKFYAEALRATSRPIHITRDRFNTLCGQVADLSCVGEEDAERGAATCPVCLKAGRLPGLSEPSCIVIVGRSIDGTVYWSGNGWGSYAFAYRFATQAGAAGMVAELCAASPRGRDVDSIVGGIHYAPARVSDLEAAMSREMKAACEAELADPFDPIADAEKLAEVKSVFESYPGWRVHSDDFDPCEMLSKIDAIVGHPVREA